MGRTYDGIDARLAQFIEAQPVFFVATAPLAPDGVLNCSPKGNRGELRVVEPTRVAYLDQTGSGIETIAHLRENGRIVLMVCAFEGPPRIVRVHGHGRAVAFDDDEFASLRPQFAGGDGVGVRSVVVIDVDRVSDSCGYAVPLMDFAAHRTTLDEWSERKGAEGVRTYWGEKNTTSIDGLAGLDL
ncbi:MAG: pyridoxamine 5'-phosphate oxidase family protein [Acidimicrobiales bacterium]